MLRSTAVVVVVAVVAATAVAAPAAVADDPASPLGDAKCQFHVKKRLPLERVLARGLKVKVSCDAPASVGVMAGFASERQSNAWADLHPGGVPGIASCDNAELERAGSATLTCKGFPKRFLRRYPKTVLEVFYGRERLDKPNVFRSVGGRDVVLVRAAAAAAAQAEPVTVGKGRVRRESGGYDVFVMPLAVPDRPLPDTVTTRLWLRPGTTTPPRPRGRATLTATMVPNDYNSFDRVRGGDQRRLRRPPVSVELLGRRGVTIVPEGNWRFGVRVRFAFAVELRQAGRRVGGFASGAVCRRVQLAHWSSIQCRAVGMRQL